MAGGIGSGTWFGFRPVQARKPYEEAVEQIADAIRSGALQVGDRLPSERVLAEQMRISRPTLREAIRVLVEGDVIEVRRGSSGGTLIVSDVIPPALLAHRATPGVHEMAGVLEARRLLEPRVAQLAALYATNDDFDAIREAIELLEEFGGDVHRRFQLETRFHLTMARATRNETVVEFMRVLFRKLEAARDLIVGGDDEPGVMIRMHHATLRAIMAGDAAEIEHVMDAHLSVLERRWEETTGRARLRRIPDFLLSPQDQLGDARRPTE
jgi:GntR family transcriptional repressor for pyruvate dehydrogenase complex